MFCTACGTAAPAGARFCGACGEPLNIPAPQTPPRAQLRVVTAAARRTRRPRARALLVLALRLLSLSGMAVTGLGIWQLVGAPPPATAVASGPAAEPETSPSLVDPIPDAGSDPPPAPATAACENHVFGYRLEYPSDWITLADPEELACRSFDPIAFDPPAGRDLPSTEIRIYVPDRSYRALDRMFDPETEPDLLDRLNLDVGGHPAFRVEVLTEEDGSDARVYAYVIDLGREALVLDTYEPFDRSYEETKAILDEMARSLEFSSGDAG